jgi:hypothetical protein
MTGIDPPQRAKGKARLAAVAVAVVIAGFPLLVYD